MFFIASEETLNHQNLFSAVGLWRSALYEHSWSDFKETGCYVTLLCLSLLAAAIVYITVSYTLPHSAHICMFIDLLNGWLLSINLLLDFCPHTCVYTDDAHVLRASYRFRSREAELNWAIIRSSKLSSIRSSFVFCVCCNPFCLFVCFFFSAIRSNF